MSTSPRQEVGHRLVRPLLVLATLGLAVHLLLPQVDEVHRTLQSLAHVRWELIVAAVATSAVTYLGAALSLRAAAAVPVELARTAEANLAGSFAGALAPANLGSLGLTGAYLRACGSSLTAASTSVALDAAAGLVVGGVLLIASALTVGRVPHPHLALPRHFAVIAVLALVLLAGGIAALLWWQLRKAGSWAALARRATSAARGAVRQLVSAVSDPRRAIGLFGGSLLVSAGYVACLFVCVLAFGGHVNLLVITFVFTAGTIVGAVAPTPGGLGAVEAAMVSGLTLFGVASGPAVAGVLLYRLATFWLPIPLGALALRDLRRRKLV